MKIYFCDGCNESIPLGDIQSGLVTTIKGKLFCRSCIPSGSLAGPTASAAPPTPASSGSRPLLVILVLVLLGWTAWRDQDLILGTGEEPAETTQAADPSDETRRRLMLIESEQFELREQNDSLSRELAGLSSALEAAGAEAQARDKLTAGLSDDISRLGIAQQAAGQLVERVQINANDVATLELRVDALSQAVAAHEADLDLRGPDTTPMVGVSNPSNDGAMTTSAPAVDPARMALLEDIRRLLLDPEPDRRFEGVDEVERGNYRELADDLLPLLQDEDMFVRLHAMNVLGNFGHEPAVPVLFDVLEDGNASIRKSAAETLVRLTGYDPGFEHKGSAGDRSRAIQKWRDWYEQRGA